MGVATRLVPLLALLVLAGCSDRPLASETELSSPSPQAPPPLDPAAVTGDLIVTTLPLDSLAPLIQDHKIVNCMYVGVDSSELISVEAGSIKLEWVAESWATETLSIAATGAGSVSGTGSSPLWLNWTADGDGLQFLPFKVQVTTASDLGVAVHQAARGSTFDSRPAQRDLRPCRPVANHPLTR